MKKIALAFALLWMVSYLTSCTNNTKTADNQEKTIDTLANQAVNKKIKQSPQIQLLGLKIKADSTNATLYFTRGNMFLQAQDVASAAQDFTKALVLDFTNATYYLATADLYFSAEQLKVAIGLLEKGIKNVGDKKGKTKMQIELGKYYLYVQKYQESIDNLDAAIKVDAKNAQAYFWKGMNYRDQQKDKQAIALLEKAVTLDKEFYNAHIILALLYNAAKSPKTIEHYQKAIDIDPTSIEAHYGKAMFWQEQGETDKALAEYRTLISKNPQYQDAYYNIGYIYFNQKDYQKALDNFTIAIRMSPTYAKAYYMRGLSAEKMGNKKEARLDYERAINFDPKLELAKKALENLK